MTRAVASIREQNAQEMAAMRSWMETSHAEQSRSATPVAPTERLLNRDFHPPTTNPPAFTGDLVGRRPQDAQGIIREWLYKVEVLAQQFGYREDFEPARYENQPWITAFAIRGLEGNALKRWMDVDPDRRRGMKWFEFKQWIQSTFGSVVSKTRLIEESLKIRQVGSAAMYCQDFNNIHASMRAAGLGDIPIETMCHRFLAGLKPELRAIHELYSLADDLPSLQARAIEIDEIRWESRRPIMSNVYTTQPQPTRRRIHDGARTMPSQQQPRLDQPRRYSSASQLPTRPFQRAHQYGAPGASEPQPMEIDALEFRTKLTDSEKAEYRAKGWCTFCRSHDHTISQCRHPNKKLFGRKVNAMYYANEFEGETSPEENYDC
jgi:hypothetical protein